MFSEASCIYDLCFPACFLLSASTNCCHSQFTDFLLHVHFWGARSGARCGSEGLEGLKVQDSDGLATEFRKGVDCIP